MQSLPYCIILFCACLVGYTYAGLPLIAFLRAVLLRKPVNRAPCTPFVSIILPAHNEERYIADKINNILAMNYLPEKWELIIASDGSTDNTESIVRRFKDHRIIFENFPRRGKNATLNDAVRKSAGEILLFTDADAMWNADTINNLLAPFSDSDVGGVAGDVVYTGQIEKNKGENCYWNYDRMLRGLLSSAGNVTAATGQIYAIRKEFFQSVPPGVNDDFYISCSVIAGGKRLVFEKTARATTPAGKPEKEFTRKIRVCVMEFRSIFIMRHSLLNPFRTGFYALQLATHKLLRRLLFVPLGTAFVTALLTVGSHPLCDLVAVTGTALCILGAIGHLLRRSRFAGIMLFALPWYFIMVNIACMVALIRLFGNPGNDLWQTQRAS